MTVELDGSSLTTDDLFSVAEERAEISVSAEAMKRMKRFRSTLIKKLEGGEVIYGVNTGYGALSDRVIQGGKVRELQENLIRSHAFGVGEPMPIEIVRAAMTIEANSLLVGNSCARPELVSLLTKAVNNHFTPLVPSFGSLGASGDLCPSAHVILALMGEGSAYYGKSLMSADAALKLAEIEPLELEAKEGISLINSTVFTTALAAIAIAKGRIMLDASNRSLALTSELIGACWQEFDPRLIRVRRVKGQLDVAASISQILSGSKRMRKSPVPQDPYSIRCAPQVHGAAKEALDFAEGIVSGELNSVTDNPIMAENGEMLHGGNFHAQPVAMVSDLLAIALAYLGGISLARTHLMLNRTDHERKFYAKEPGLESGLMIADYVATSLVAENSHLVHPVSAYPANVTSGVEDHASFGVNAGLKALKVLDNVSRIVSIELVCASCGVDEFEATGLAKTTKGVYDFVRKISPPLRGDRSMSNEFETLARNVLIGSLQASAKKKKARSRPNPGRSPAAIPH